MTTPIYILSVRSPLPDRAKSVINLMGELKMPCEIVFGPNHVEEDDWRERCQDVKVERQSSGAACCFQGHVNIWRQFLESSHEQCLVMEDDARIQLGRKGVIRGIENIPQGFDWAMMHSFGRQWVKDWAADDQVPFETNDVWQGARPCHTICTVAYMLSRKGATLLLERLPKAAPDQAVDQFMQQHSRDRQCYQIRERITPLNPNWKVSSLIAQNKGIILLHDRHGGHDRWYAPLERYFRNRARKVERIGGPLDLSKVIAKEPEQVIIWNGAERGTRQNVIDIRDAGINVAVAEVGFFPQRDYLILDPEGINAESSIAKNRKLPEIQPEWREELARLRVKYARENLVAPKDWADVLLVLQCEADTNMRNHAPYKTNQAFIDAMAEKYRSERVLVRKHPLERKVPTLPDGWRWSEEEDVRDAIHRAKRVHGQNSTVLLEAALMGKAVIAEGEGYLKTHHDQLEHLLTVLAGKQIPVQTADITPWLWTMKPLTQPAKAAAT